MLLVILILLFAAAGGFLGDLLRLAGWVIVFFVGLGVVASLALYVMIQRLKDRFQ